MDLAGDPTLPEAWRGNRTGALPRPSAVCDDVDADKRGEPGATAAEGATAVFLATGESGCGTERRFEGGMVVNPDDAGVGVVASRTSDGDAGSIGASVRDDVCASWAAVMPSDGAVDVRARSALLS